MRNLRILTVTLVCLGMALPVAWAQAPDAEGTAVPAIEWQSFDQAIVSAQSAGKHIMVDVYTDWCGWCKKLDKETYADAGVRQVLSESYVSSKVKGDSDKRVRVRSQPYEKEGRTLVQFLPADEADISERDLSRGQWRVTGYPTILFFSSEGKLITKLPGYYNAESFLNILNFIKDDLYEVMTYDDYLKSVQEAAAQTDGQKS